MKILRNKFFILGNLLLLLIAIPVTLFFVKKQQELRGRAAASSKLYFEPAAPNTSTTCQSFNVDVMIDPGSNLISIIDFYITYDANSLSVSSITPSNNFSTVVRSSSIGSGQANMSLSVGADVTRAVSSKAKVATIAFIPKIAGSAQVQFDSSKSRVFSLGPQDQPTENVLSSVDPSNVAISSGACPNGGTGGTGGTTPTVTPATTTTITPAQPNMAPLCTGLSVSPSASGSAPLSVLFTGQGNDPDAKGLIKKASFNFGDGQTQDVTAGLNQKTVSVQANHTYQGGGTFSASLVFTDDIGVLSQSCNQTITASGAASATPTVTPIPTVVQKPTATPTLVEKPTIPPSGNVAQTLGVVGVTILTIIGGLFLLAL